MTESICPVLGEIRFVVTSEVPVYPSLVQENICFTYNISFDKCFLSNIHQSPLFC